MRFSLRSSMLSLFYFVVALFPLTAHSQQLIDWVPIANQWPGIMAVNPATNTIYVAEVAANTLNVINGTTDALTPVQLSTSPSAIAVNTATNKIYLATEYGVTVLDGATNNLTNTSVNGYIVALAVNATTNTIYAADSYDNLLWVINGGTNQATSIPVGQSPVQVVVDPVMNLAFVANGESMTTTVINTTNNQVVKTLDIAGTLAVNTVTHTVYALGLSALFVINESTLAVTTVQLPEECAGLFLNTATNTIYTVGVTETGYPILSIDGNTFKIVTITTLAVAPAGMIYDATTNQFYMTFQDYWIMGDVDASSGTFSYINVGEFPVYLIANETTNRIYVGNRGGESVSVISGAPYPLQFVPVTPCRLVDTRNSGGILPANSTTSFAVATLNNCLPQNANAKAYSLNVTVVPPIHGVLGYLTIWPSGEKQPVVSTLNSPDGRTKANAAIVPFGQGGAVSVYVSDATDLILDIDGYFTAPTHGSLQFYPVDPCRLVDTRGADGPLGGPRLAAQQQRDFPLRDSKCIPSGLSIQAYSLNFTVVPNPTGQPLGYLSVWPTGQTQPVVSTLNNPTATVVANAALVPAGTNGDIEVYGYNTTDLLIDINGYFAAPGNGGLSMYPLGPCRVLDTRQNGGQPFQGPLTVNVVGSPCNPPSGALSYIFNATVIPSGSMPYLTLWADGQKQPDVSTLNAYDGFITSNMAIVPTNNGSIDAYAAGLTQLLLDISGYFAP